MYGRYIVGYESERGVQHLGRVDSDTDRLTAPFQSEAASLLVRAVVVDEN